MPRHRQLGRAVKFNYWQENGSLVIDSPDGYHQEKIAYVSPIDGYTDQITVSACNGTNVVQLATQGDDIS